MRTHLLPLGAALVALFFALAAPAAHAQGTTTATISGTVLDADGLPLPGTTVLAVHEPSGTEYRAAARGDGRYDLRGLRVGGPYTVTATFIGFQGQARTGVQLALSQAETVDFTLAEDAQQLGVVTVTAASNDAIIAAGRTGASTNVTEEQIDAIPSISRSLSDFARLSPLSGGQGSSSVAGRSFRANNTVVDGATLNDVFGLAGTGGTPGGQTGSQPISLDAVEQLNLDIAPYDVRFGNFTGAQINAVTKSGTNQFRGSLRFLNRSTDFVGDFRGVPFTNFSERLYIGTLGGPILRDRLFFFLSAEQFNNSFPNDVGLAGSGAATTFRGTREQVQGVIDAAQTFGYDAGSLDPFADNRLSTKILGKIDWNINPTNRLSVRHNFVDADDDQGVARGQTGFSLTNGGYVFRNRTNSTTAQLNSTLGSRATNEGRIVYTRIRDQRAASATPFPQTEIRLADNASVNLGVNRSSQANSLDQDLYELTDNLTLFRGAHTVTLGTTNQYFHINNLFVQDFYGSYAFNQITEDVNGDGVNETLSATEAFAAGRPVQYQLSYAAQLQFDAQGRLLVNGAGVPVRSADVGATPRAEFSAFQLGLYAQDEWAVNDRFRLTGGLRMDIPVFPDTPLDNPVVRGAPAYTQSADGSTTQVDLLPAFRREAFETFAADRGAAGRFQYEDYSNLSTTNTPSSAPLFSPRLGFNYRADGFRGRTLQIRGGTGIFSGRSPFVFISNLYGNTGVDLARLSVGSRDNGTSLGQVFSPSSNPADQPLIGVGPGGVAATTTVNLVDPGFKFPQSWRTNLGIDQELGNGFTATLEGIVSDAYNEVRYVNLNYAQTGVSSYGRPLYTRGVSDAFTDAILLTNTDAGYEYSAYAQIQRRVRSGLGGSLSYTYSRAFNSQNATSDVALSNWQFNENVDINGVDLGTADFETRHRVLAYSTYRREYGGRFSSELGVILDSQSGEPYSFIYNGDANGDRQSGNDLIYVPQNETDVFLTTGNWPLLDAYITGQSDLDDARGGFISRNSARAPWNTRLDLNFTQGVNTVRGQRLEFEMTMQNVLNFVNDSWGRIHISNFNNYRLLDFGGYVTDAQVGTTLAGRIVTSDDVGKPIFGFDTENTVDPDNRITERLDGTRTSLASLGSRWQVRFGVRYQF